MEAEKSVVEAEQSAVEAEKSAVVAEKSAVVAEKSAVEAEEPAVEAEEPAVEAEKSVLEAEKSAVEAEQSAVEAEKSAVEAGEPAFAQLSASSEDAMRATREAEREGELLRLVEVRLQSVAAEVNGLRLQQAELATKTIEIEKIGAQQAELASTVAAEGERLRQFEASLATKAAEVESLRQTQLHLAGETAAEAERVRAMEIQLQGKLNTAERLSSPGSTRESRIPVRCSGSVVARPASAPSTPFPSRLPRASLGAPAAPSSAGRVSLLRTPLRGSESPDKVLGKRFTTPPSKQVSATSRGHPPVRESLGSSRKTATPVFRREQAHVGKLVHSSPQVTAPSTSIGSAGKTKTVNPSPSSASKRAWGVHLVSPRPSPASALVSPAAASPARSSKMVPMVAAALWAAKIPTQKNVEISVRKPVVGACPPKLSPGTGFYDEVLKSVLYSSSGVRGFQETASGSPSKLREKLKHSSTGKASGKANIKVDRSSRRSGLNF